ncbi:uncharacterized protein LOC126905567 [Daktulosphaira vitifoliae]|uniref:uncharacterized protein LOC126905567 n=1 Tax=Daktulosphaira vitifoliae TaxID=58002 RepID=UPI0021AA07FF|nr:uncharacterized protein LOC126905567 [Daktulosphaira vitifoliae]
MDKNSVNYQSCIKLCGIRIVSPLMTSIKRQEMKKYKERAMTLEHKLKGKRVSMDSGVMTASAELQKIENLESPTIYNNELNIYEKQNNKSNNSLNLYPEEINTSKTPLEYSVNKNHTLSCDQSAVESQCIKSKDISNKENIFVNYIFQDNSNITDLTTSEDDVSVKTDTPRIRSSSYTLSSPSPSMVAFLNSQIQQNLIKFKYLEKYHTSIDCKSEPPSISKEITNETNNLTKSSSLCSVSKVMDNEVFIQNLDKLRKNSTFCETLDVLKNDDKIQVHGVNTKSMHGVNLSDDESIVASAVTVLNGNDFENDSNTNSMIRQCCCKHSDDEFSLNSIMQYKTSEEIKLEAEQLKKEKLEIDNRHQEELSNLIKKQREEQQQLALKIFLISQNSSGISLNQSENSEICQESYKNPSITLSETTLTNDKSLLSDTSSIISNCSINRSSRACSSPRQNPPNRSPSLLQNIKFYHRIRNGTNAKWSKPPTEVENSAAIVINAAVRGYLTRRLLKTEKAQMLKKTILDSLKTALIMHVELKKQQPTESDLELHQRIINQLTVACYDLNDLILGSVHERMSIIRGDRERIKAIKQRRKSTPSINYKITPTYKKPKKSSSGYSLSKINSGHLLEKKP